VTDRSASKPFPAGGRVGIFGGTFNPVHDCHLEVAQACLDLLGLDRVLFIPAGDPPHRHTALAPARNRLEMVGLALAGHPRFVVSDVELRRSGPSYTADTLAILKAEHPEVSWTLILGLDAVLGLPSWHRPEFVVRQCPIAIPFRPGAGFRELARCATLAGVDFGPLEAATGTTPFHLTSPDGIELIPLPITPCPTSATQVRADLKSGKSPIPGLSPTVTAYIIEHSLYA